MQGAVLAVLEQPDEAAALLDAAGQVGRLFGAGVQALAVRIPAEATILPSEEVMSLAACESWDAAEGERLAALGVLAGAAGVVLHAPTGDPATCLVAQAAAAGLLVLPRPHEGCSATFDALLQTALFGCGRAVLLVPPGFTGELGRRVAVAWKADGQADRAVLAALPLLRRAERILLLATDPGAQPAVLRDADLPAELVLLPEAGPEGSGAQDQGADGLGAAILAAAAGCDLLVMGAYGHGRLREMILGGVTRHVLAQAPMAVLMCH